MHRTEPEKACNRAVHRQARPMSGWSRKALAGFTILVLGSQASAVQAQCNEEDLLIARDLATRAEDSDNDTIRLLLLKQSLDTCSAFPVWLQLGELQMAMDKPFDAIYAFEHAADFLPAAGSELTPNQLLRRAISNARLGEAYHAADELVMALVATQEAVDAFDELALIAPRRLVHLQAKLDDAVSRADADVLTRMLEIQQDRAHRGVAGPGRLRPAVESAIEVEASLQQLADFSGDPVLSLESSGIGHVSDSAPLEVATDLPSHLPSEARIAVPQPSQETTEVRLNIPVLFEFNSARLSEQSLATVAELATALARLELDAIDTVVVVGHTDSRGSAEYNRELSDERARVVADELQRRLDAASSTDFRLEHQGRGESELRYQGNQVDDHRRNRRVEVIVRQG